MTGILASHLRYHIIKPALELMGKWSKPAEDLLMGTAAVESQLGHWLVQEGGPALGIFQMEPNTYYSLWTHYISRKANLRNGILRAVEAESLPTPFRMTYDLRYAAIMARVKYLPDPAPIPDDLQGQAEYWKRVYNTPKGKGTVSSYMLRYKKLCVESKVGRIE